MTQELIDQAKSAIANREFESALKLLDEVLLQNPEDQIALELNAEAQEKLTNHAKRLIMRAREEMAVESYEHAISLLNPVLDLAQNHPSIAEMINKPEVEQLRERAYEKQFQSRLSTANQALEERDYRRARAVLESIHAQDDPQTRILLNQVLYAFDRASYLKRRARHAMENRQFADAVQYLQELTATFPQYDSEVETMLRSALYYDLITHARSAREQGLFEEAIDSYRQAISMIPKEQNLDADLNELIATLKESDLLLSRRQKADEIVARAKPLVEAEDFSVATKLVKQALELDPEHENAQGLLQDAQEHLSEQRKKKLETLIAKSRQAIEDHDLPLAHQNLKQARQISPQDDEVKELDSELELLDRKKRMLSRAERAVADRDFATATQLYGRVLTLDPDNVMASKGLQRLGFEQWLIRRRYNLNEENAEETVRMLQEEMTRVEFADLQEEMFTLINKAKSLIARKTEVRHQLEEARTLLAYNQPIRAMEITRKLLHESPDDRAVLEVHKKAFEKSVQQSPSAVQYILALVFIIVLIFSLLRLLGAW